MNEQQWLSSTDPIAMVEFLRGSPTNEDTVTWWNNRWQLDEPSKGNDRKFRLFACACCRRIWDCIPEVCNRDAIVAVEDFLDGRRTGQALKAALVASSAVESERRSEPGYWVVKYLGRGFYKMTAAASALLVSSKVLFMADEETGSVASHAFGACYYSAAGVFLSPFRWPEPMPTAVEDECATQAALLRCVFSNPFRPQPSTELAWLTRNDGAARRIAQAIYDERELSSGALNNDRLAILADALEEAGCDNDDILRHCRQQGGFHVRGCWVIDLLLNNP